MKRFTFEAIDAQGRRRTDSIEARSREDLLLTLESKGLILLRWMNKKPSGQLFFKWSTRRLKAGQLLQFTKELAHLLKSDLPLDRALTVVADAASEEPVRETAIYLKSSLQEGNSLSEAMAARPADYNELYLNMVRVGEMGGILPQVLAKLEQFMERSEEIKRFIISSSIYPAILLCVGMISILVIMGVVVPRFAGIFNDLGQEIPASTQVLIVLSRLIRDWWWLMVVTAMVLVVFLRQIATNPSGKDFLDRLLIRMPVFGALVKEIQVSRFARTFGTLMQSGVPLLKALSIVRDVVGNIVVKNAVGNIYHQVKEGKRVSSLMKKQTIFPPMAVQMVLLGEETGRLGEMLVAVAEDLDDKIQNKIKTYLALLEPLSILLMGLVIGGIVVSMLSAIFGINEIEF